MRLIFIHGPAASGKYTVGKALQEITGFKLFHNHLVVDTLMEVFPFGSEPFVKLREEFWLSIFEAAAKHGVSLIFTFAPEATVDAAFVEKARAAVAKGRGEIDFVKLTCPVSEQEARIENPSRFRFRKLRSLKILRELRATGANSFPTLPAGLEIDTGKLSPTEAAEKITLELSLRPIL